MKSSPIGLLVAAALGIFPAQSFAQGKGKAKPAAAASDTAAADKPAAADDATGKTDAAAAGDTGDTGDEEAPPEAGGDTGQGLADICKIDPAACPNLDMDKEAARPIKEQIFAAQQLYVLRRGRFEIQPYWSITLNDQFVGHPAPGLALNYYVTNVLAVGLNGNFYNPFNVDQEFNGQVRRAARVAVPLTEYNWGAAFNFTYVPAYGKFAGFSDFIFHYDAYVVGGVGAMSVRPIPIIDPDNRNFSYKTKLAFNAGIGLRIFFNRWFAAVMEVRDYIFNDQLESLSTPATQAQATDPSTWYGDSKLTNNIQAQVGAAIFLPLSFDYRLPK